MRLPIPGRCGPIGLDIDARAIHAVQVRTEGDAVTLHAAASLPRNLPDGADPRPGVDELSRLRLALERLGFEGCEAVVAVPNDQLLSGVVDLPPITGAALLQVARSELGRLHRCEPLGLEVAVWDLPLRRRRGDAPDSPEAEQRAMRPMMATGCRATDAHALLEPFEAAGFDVSVLDVPGLALVRACLPLLSGPEEPAALLDLRWDAAVLVMPYRDMMLYERTLPESGLTALLNAVRARAGIDETLAAALLFDEGEPGGAGEPLTAAEGVPSSAPSQPQAQAPVPQAGAGPVGELLRVHIERLVREIRASCAYLDHRFPGSAPRQLLLAGAGAELAGMEDSFARGLSMPVRRLSPGALAVNGRCGARGERPAIVTALGLAQSRGQAA